MTHQHRTAPAGILATIGRGYTSLIIGLLALAAAAFGASVLFRWLGV